MSVRSGLGSPGATCLFLKISTSSCGGKEKGKLPEESEVDKGSVGCRGIKAIPGAGPSCRQILGI